MSLSTFIKSSRDITRGDSGINGDAQRIEQLTWMLFLKVYDAKESTWELLEPGYQSIIPEHLRWRNWATDHKDGKALTGQNLLDFLNEELFPTLKKLMVTKTTPMRQAIVPGVFEDTNQYMKDGVLIRELVNLIDEIDFDDYQESHTFGVIYETLLRQLQNAGSYGEFYTPRAVTEFMVKATAPTLDDTIADFAAGTGGFLVSALHAVEKQITNVEDRAARFQNIVYGVEKKPMPYLLGVTNLLLNGIESPAYFHGNSLERSVRSYKEDEKFSLILMNPPYGGKEQEAVQTNFPANLRSSETADLFMTLIMYRLKRNGRAAVVLPDGLLFGSDRAKVEIKKKLLADFNLHTIVRLPGSVFAPYTSIATNLLFFDNTGPTETTWFYRVDLPEGYKAFSKTKPMEIKHFDDCWAWWCDRTDITDEGGTYKAKAFTAQELIDLGYNLDQCGYPKETQEILSPEETISNYKKRRAELDAAIDAKIAEIEALLAVKA